MQEQPILTDDELEAVVLAAFPTDGTPIAETELDRVIAWARQARIDGALLAGLIDGSYRVRAVEGSELQFGLRGLGD